MYACIKSWASYRDWGLSDHMRVVCNSNNTFMGACKAAMMLMLVIQPKRWQLRNLLCYSFYSHCYLMLLNINLMSFSWIARQSLISDEIYTQILRKSNKHINYIFVQVIRGELQILSVNNDHLTFHDRLMLSKTKFDKNNNRI